MVEINDNEMGLICFYRVDSVNVAERYRLGVLRGEVNAIRFRIMSINQERGSEKQASLHG